MLELVAQFVTYIEIMNWISFHHFQELLSMIPCMQKNEPNWDELRQFGVGWWVTNMRILRQMMEQVAKCAFQSRKEPLDSALFYLAMRKKNVLWGLYRWESNLSWRIWFLVALLEFHISTWNTVAISVARFVFSVLFHYIQVELCCYQVFSSLSVIIP